MQIQVSDGFHRLHLRPSYQCTARECERKVELKSCFGCCLNIGMKDPSHEFPIRTFRFVSFGKRDYGSREGNVSLQRLWHFCRQKVATTLITHCVCVRLKLRLNQHPQGRGGSQWKCTWSTDTVSQASASSMNISCRVCEGKHLPGCIMNGERY